MRLALGGVEVGRRERQIDVVDGDELAARAIAALVPSELEVLRAAQRKLRAELLELAPELRDLLGQLPVHVLRFTRRFSQLFRVLRADDLGAHRTVGRHHLLHHPRGKVHAGLDQHWVHDFARAGERGSPRCVVAESGAPQSFLIHLVAALACVFVAADLVEQVLNDNFQLALIDFVDDVGKMLAFHSDVHFVLQFDDRAAVFGVDDLGRFELDLDHFGLHCDRFLLVGVHRVSH